MGAAPYGPDGERSHDETTGPAWAAWLAQTVAYATSTRPGGPRSGSGPGVDQMAGSSLRASDAERSDVAERLGKHYGEGRLDQVEFDDRLQKAMTAKTRGELAALLTDLPAQPVPHQATNDSFLHRMVVDIAPAVVYILIAVLAVAGVVLLGPSHGASLVVFLVALLAVRRYRSAHALRRYHDHLHEHDTPHWHGPKGPQAIPPPAAVGHGRRPRH